MTTTPVHRGQVRQLAGRAGWNLADQVVSSGTNLLLSVLAARALTEDGFGAFAVAFTIYSLFVAAGRALISQPLTVRYTAGGPEVFHQASRAATGASVLLGVAAGAVTTVAGLVIGGALGAALVCFGVLLPGLLLQDMWRAVFITGGRPAAALVNDLVWAAVQISAVVVLIVQEWSSATTLVAAWGGAALVAAVVGGFQLGSRPVVVASVAWLREQRDLLGYYLASFLSVMGASQLTMLLIAGLGEPSYVGALRAAQVVLGPLNLAGYSLAAFALPEIARRRLVGAAALRVAVALSAVMVLGALVWGGMLLLLPDRAGTALLGDSWDSAQEVLPAALLGVGAIGVGFGATLLMTALGYAKETFWINALLAPSFLVLGLVGLRLGQAPGAALGLALAQCVVVPVAWYRVVTLMRRETPVPERAGPVPS